MWLAIISAFEKTLVTRTHKFEEKAKIQGLLKDLRSDSQTCIRWPLLGPLKSDRLGQVVILQNTFIK